LQGEYLFIFLIGYKGLAKFLGRLKQLPYLPTNGRSRNEVSNPPSKPRKFTYLYFDQTNLVGLLVFIN
jgi:hypothetical protein